MASTPVSLETIPKDGFEPFPRDQWRLFFEQASFNDECIQYYLELFELHDIEFNMIQDLEHPLLLQMGVLKVGHRIKILRMKDSFFLPNEDKYIRINSPIRPRKPRNGFQLRKNGSTHKLSRRSTPMRLSKSMSNTVELDECDYIVALDTEYPEPFPIEVSFFINEDPKKNLITVDNGDVSLFLKLVERDHKLTEEIAVFTFNEEEHLRIVKQDETLDAEEIYYCIANNRVDTLSKRITKRVKKSKYHENASTDIDQTDPIEVYFLPTSDVYLSEGNIGMCMAPGRLKKHKSDWKRELGDDLDRIHNIYNCDVLVTLGIFFVCFELTFTVRHSELRDIGIPNLITEATSRGMESIHFPIKDKSVPGSMQRLIVTVEAIIERLKEGKTVVVHCNGGKGRSGLIVVATLVGLGKKVDKAIESVRNTRYVLENLNSNWVDQEHFEIQSKLYMLKSLKNIGLNTKNKRVSKMD
eukprot:TRINITY_DN4824_c0_g1_i3.p1 TRINITY_DN4824_c0_g1~~TRINITY_DN4824_c0_g1_i3.p1  ORF type:complete len:469 (+),score=91.90 TRINITY_DN4824_c0_g1_i3:36-1442(+)